MSEPVVEFAAGLRKLREQAGSPGYRSLARRVNFSAATLAAAASGRRLPTLPVTLAYVEACGGDRQEWSARWRAVAALSRDDDEEAGESSADALSPYVGLATFQPDDAELFFGRDRLVEELVRRLSRSRLVVVFGPSGVGKSSVVRAGLLPAVRAGVLSDDETGSWPTVLIVPGVRPLTEVALRLAALAKVPAGALLDDLAADPAHADLVVRQALCDEPEGTRLLLVVDQFEGVFSADVDAAERDGFVAVLVALCQASGNRARVILTARADHYARFVEYPDLLAAMADGQMLVGGMSPAELRDAVVKPAERVGARVEGALVSAIVAEVAGRPGALPLASHALLEAWRRRRGTTVTLAGYEAAGGVDGAVAATAERVYRTFDDDQRRVVRRLLLRMVDVDAQGMVKGRRVPRSELRSTDAGAVVDRLADARLLSTDRDSVEMAHEALIQAWPRLREWVEDDRDGLRIHRALTDAVADWEALGRDEGALYRGARLAAATQWAESRLEALTPDERRFLDASVNLRQREAAAGRRRRLVAWTSFALASVLLAVTSVVALVQADHASSERDRAFAQQLTSHARAQRRSDPEIALMLAMHAYELWPSAETESVLRQATADSRIAMTFRGHHAPVTRLAFSPTGQRIASADAGRVHVWDPARRTPPTSYDFQRVSAMAFSPDGTRLAVTTPMPDGRGDRLIVWTVETRDAVTIDAPVADTATRIAFSPDGRLAAIGDLAGMIRIVDMTTHRVAAAVLRGTSAVSSLTFTRNGRQIARTDANGSITTWNLARPDRPAHTPAVGPLRSSSLSADGRQIAFTDGEQVISAAADMTNRVTLQGGRGVSQVTISPDGQRIAAPHDRTIQVWELTNPGRPLTLYSPSPVSDLTFSPDGFRLVTGSTDAAVRVWDLSAGLASVVEVAGATGGLMAMSADGSAVAAASARDRAIHVSRSGGDTLVLSGAPTGDGGLRMSGNGRTVAAFTVGSNDVSVWNVGVEQPRLLRCADVVGEVELSPDGRWAAVICADGVARLWDLNDGGRKPISLPHAAAPPFAFSPDGQLLASGVDDEPITTVMVCRVRNAAVAFTETTSDHITDLEFGPDNSQLAVQARDGSLRMYSVGGGANTPTVLASTPTLTADTAFSPDGRLVANTTNEDTVRIQNVDGTGEPIILERSGPPMIALGFAPDGHDLVTLHNDATARRLPCDACAPITAVVALAHQHITRDFTPEERRKYLHESN